jgi:hypothetical protein
LAIYILPPAVPINPVLNVGRYIEQNRVNTLRRYLLFTTPEIKRIGKRWRGQVGTSICCLIKFAGYVKCPQGFQLLSVLAA